MTPAPCSKTLSVDAECYVRLSQLTVELKQHCEVLQERRHSTESSCPPRAVRCHR